MSRAVMVKDFEGRLLVKKEEKATLRGTVVILKPDESEIAKKLEIKVKGFFGMKFK
jgi:RNA polymerase subunit RPABC4/transcription elongation factor Spt4